MKKKLLWLFLSFLGVACTEELDYNVNSSIQNRSVEDVTIMEVAFPSRERELVTFPNGLVLEKVDSIYIWQNDIILTQDQVDMMSSNKSRSAYIMSAFKYWKSSHVNYSFAPGFIGKDMVQQAISHWERNTSVKFSESATGDYIEFYNGNGNFSQIGRIGGKQQISLKNGYFNTGSAIHEIGHAMGLFHEQCRTDRDKYITILWDNIKKEKRHNFETFTDGGYDGTNFEEFDFNSIMLYSSKTTDNTFANDIDKPMMVKKDNSTFVGQRSYLSDGDKKAIEAIYGPPYTRLVTELVQVLEENFTSTYERYHYKYENTVYFYADKECKIKTNLIYPRKIAYTLSHTERYSYFENAQHYTQEYEQLVPAGRDYCVIGWTTIDVEMDFGNEKGIWEAYSLY